MDNTKIIEYINTMTGQGFGQDNIYNTLVTAGWDRKTIIQSFMTIFGKKVNLSVLRLGKIATLIEETFKLYRSHFWLYFSLSLIPLFIIISTYLLTPFILILTKYPSSFLWSLPIYLLMIAFAGLIQIWFHSVLIYSIVNHDNVINLREALSYCWLRLYKFWLITTIASILLVIGGVFLIIPGIFLFVSLSFVTYIFFEENLNGVPAIKKSYYYVKGNWWDIFGRILIFGLGMSAISLLPKQLLSFIKNPFITTPISILLIIFYLLEIPVYTIFMFLIYKKMKEIKSLI
jgi:hypothetical protein